MKNIFPILCLMILLGTGCLPSSNLPLQSDFEPVRSKSTAPTGIDPLQEGPYERRIMTAVSYDGITFTQNDRWVCDQCHVPDAVVKGETMYLYYTGWVVGDRINTSAVAISSDAGASWTYKYLELVDGGPIDRVLHPDVILLEDGTFRLFFTGGNPQGIHYAESQDGVTFAYKGIIFGQQDDVAVASTTMKINDTWHLYALSEEGVDRIWHLTGTDGVSFSVYDLLSFPNDGIVSTPSNGLWINDRFSLLMFSPKGTIGSMWTKNGFDWYPSQVTHLEPVGNEKYVEDPALLALPNGQYLLFYVTNIE